MDFNLLVEEILARVSEHLASDSVNGEKNPVKDKAKLLVLTECHGTNCHDLLDNSNLQKNYHMECALERGYNYNVADYEAVVLYNLSIDALGKLASGICDTPYISLATKAILMGKKIFVPNEEVELYSYKDTAPYTYYSMMNEKLKRLSDSGVIFCKKEDIEKFILKECNLTGCDEDMIKQDEIKKDEIKKDEIKQDGTMEDANSDIKPYRFNKKIITEGDIRKLFAEGVKKISINSNAILTDLAKEYIHNKKIEVKRESLADGKLGKGL